MTWRGEEEGGRRGEGGEREGEREGRGSRRGMVGKGEEEGRNNKVLRSEPYICNPQVYIIYE